MTARKIVLKILGLCCSVLILMLVIYAIYHGGKFAYDFGYRVFTEPPIDTVEEATDKIVQIKSEMGALEIGETLEKKGLIRDAELFVVQLKLSSYAKDIKEGTYTLSTSMTAREMMAAMSADVEEETETEE